MRWKIALPDSKGADLHAALDPALASPGAVTRNRTRTGHHYCPGNAARRRFSRWTRFGSTPKTSMDCFALLLSF